MAVLRCLGFSSGIPANQATEVLVFPTSSLLSEDTSAAATPPASESRSLLSSESSLPSFPSLHNPSPDRSSGTYSVSSCKTTYGAVHSLAISDSSLFAGTSSAALLRFSKTAKPMESETLAGASYFGTVKSIGFSTGRIFTAYQDGRIRVWKSSESDGLHRVASLPTVSDRALRFLLPRNHVQVRRHRTSLWINHVDAVSALAVRDSFLYSVSWDRTLKVWRVSDLRCIESVRAHDDAVNALVVSSDGTVYTGSADTTIRVWARSEGAKKHSLVATLEKHRSAVNALALSSDGSVLYSGACDRSIMVWEKADGPHHMTLIGRLHGHKGPVLCLAFAYEFLFSGSADQTVRIWRRVSGNRYSSVAVLEGHERPVKSLAVAAASPTSESVLVYSGSLDGEVRAWRVWCPSSDCSTPN